MPLVLGFALLGGAVLLLTSAITGASFGDVIKGNAGELYREHHAAHAAAAVTAGVTGSTGAGGTGSPVSGTTGHGTGKFGSLVSGLTFAGPDQGVDFTGQGKIFAPVDVKITRIDSHSGWPGGQIIVGEVVDRSIGQRLGHGYGRFIYFAEALNPVAGLRVGDIVPAGHQIASLNSAYPGTEIGWAQDARGTAFGTTHDGKAGGPSPVHGNAFAAWLQGLRLIGAPR